MGGMAVMRHHRAVGSGPLRADRLAWGCAGAWLMSALNNVLSRLSNVRTEGDSYRASCPLPSHGQGRGDRDPSLSVTVGDDGRVLLNCFANCETKLIIE